MSQDHYILFSIGPVQSAIAQARRTQDLWTGSQILSHLAFAGLVWAARSGTEIVYPAVELDFDLIQHGQLSIPNRFMLRTSAPDPLGVAQEIEGEIRERWRYIAEAVAGGIQRDGMRFNYRELWQPQIENYLEIYYVLVPATRDYRADNWQINVRMHTRKQLRAFEQTAERGFKCSITGEHEALHDQAPGEISYSALRQYWETVRKRHRNKAMFSQGEHLCAPSLVKRMARDYDTGMQVTRFPSTSSIASAPYRAGIIALWEVMEPLIGDYLRSLVVVFETAGASEETLFFAQPELFPYISDIIAQHQLRVNRDSVLDRFLKLDGDWLYPETLTVREIETYLDEKLRGERRDSVLAALNQAAAKLRKLRERMAELLQSRLAQSGGQPSPVNLAPPSDYYAVVAMDGDSMGDVVGDFRDASKHRSFSAKLVDFARRVVRPTAEQRTPGRVIYAGGDDLLLMVPLPYLVYVMWRIEDEFGASDLQTTISAGAAIVHRTHPLQDAVQNAREAEAEAKRIAGKDAFSIRLLRRSGEPKSGRSKWRVAGEDVLRTLAEVAVAMRRGKLARGLPADMVAMTYALVPQPEPEGSLARAVNMPVEARHYAFKHLFERRCEASYRGTPAANALLDRLQRIGDDAGVAGLGWLDLTDLLQVARFLSQEGGVYVDTD